MPNCYLNECINCPKNCETCVNNQTCLICSGSYSNFDGECGQHCKPGWSKNHEGVCVEFCGDGVRRAELPYCDDGNNFDNDGCSSSCQVEDGWACRDGGKESRDHCIKRLVLNIVQSSTNTSIVYLEFSKKMDCPDNITTFVTFCYRIFGRS